MIPSILFTWLCSRVTRIGICSIKDEMSSVSFFLLMSFERRKRDRASDILNQFLFIRADIFMLIDFAT